MVSSVYIHIPFCEKKCYYCDFNSYANSRRLIKDYLKYLDKEMELQTKLYPPYEIKTIYIGGGTPSTLDSGELELLFASIDKHFPNRSFNLEFTIEINPGTVDLDKLKTMKKHGVNRISMGVQAFQDKLLKEIGRIHTEEEIYTSIKNIRDTGFNNVSIDLMFGLPNQTKEMLKESLAKAFKLDIQHISVYSLKVEENTVFYDLQQKNKLSLPTEDEELEMFLLTTDEMESHGFKQYEISNFAKANYKSKHNINYWRNEFYYGLGAGAHGYINERRNENINGIVPYINKLKTEKMPFEYEYEVLLAEKMENMMMLGLRMLEGIKYTDFSNQFHIDLREKYKNEIRKLSNQGLITLSEDGICLSKKGLIYGNNVFLEFISLGD